MKASRPISLFADPQPSREDSSSSFLVSIVLHAFLLGLLYLGLKYTPRIENPTLAQRYTVRLLNLQRTEPRVHWAAARGGAQPAPRAVGRAVAPGSRPAAPSVPRLLVQAVPAPQTLVQPDLPPNLLLPQKTPIPLVLMWAPENVSVRQIVAPQPQKLIVANVKPSLITPNREVKPADLKIAASAFVTETLPLPPSTTSPITVHGPEAVNRVPETASPSHAQPTPARVMSLSDLQLEKGTIVLPLVNETAPASSSGPLAPERSESAPGAGGNSASKQNGMGVGQNSGEQGNQVAAGTGPAGQNGTKTTSGAGFDGASPEGIEPATTRITLPKDGKFGVVVVGASLADEYPETLGMWTDRLAYTVYLHVGLTKSWILQYSLPRAAQTAAGSDVRPEAPWPYLMVRPHLAPDDSDADAIMVHGFVNAGGRFEKLAIVFPPKFAQAKFVLGSLNQWQFRPAIKNGQFTAVEVLLIIPDESQ